MTWQTVQSAIPNFAWRAVQTCMICILCLLSGFQGGCEDKQDRRDELLFEAPVGPEGGTIVIPSSDPALADYAGTTLQVPSGAFPGPVTIAFYRTAGRDTPGARFVGAALKIVAHGSASQVAQDILHISMPLPDGIGASGDRNVMAVEWPSGERFLTGGLTQREPGKPPQLLIETPKLGSFFPVIYPLGPAMPEPLIYPLDVLLVVDNSSSMSAFQSLLFQHNGSNSVQKKSLPWKILNSSAVDKCKPAKVANSISNIHMAVVSSDLGVMPKLPIAAGSDWPSPLPTAFTAGKCGPRGTDPMKKHGNGDDGELQTKRCTERGITDSTVCPSVCTDPIPVPETGLPYIRKWTEFDAKKMDIVTYPEYATGKRPETAIHCRAILGEGGCGIEMPIGSAAQAISRQNSMPSGFLRDPATSLLVVIFVTNEDDCTIASARRKDAYPSSAKYVTNRSGLRENCGMLSAPECFNMEYRCFALDNQCNESLSMPGSKTGCKTKSVNPNPYLASVEELVKQMASYQDGMGKTQYRSIGFVTIAPSGSDFETEYLPDGMMTTMLTPYLNIKQQKKTYVGKDFLLGPQLRYEKLYQLKNSAVATERFIDTKLGDAVDFVIKQNIEALIDPATGQADEMELNKLVDALHTKTAPFLKLQKAGMDSGFTEPCP